jgi:acetyl/propionyl-CoA carboxylase alpha subunit
VHRVPDYSGSNKEERNARIQQIIDIAQDNGYDSVFAGYGFMAEDEAMVAALERAGLNFIGPCSRTVHDAGLKDEAKRTALAVGVSVTPGIDNGTALTLLKKCPDAGALQALCDELDLSPATGALTESDTTLEDMADLVLAASYKKGVDLYTIDELCVTLTEAVQKMAVDYPENRIRLKAIGGGGGKGQRILDIGESERTAEMVREILNEVKTTGVGDNKNVLVELNIETTRHQEIQVIGNGHWSLSMGGRDCSLQMHEQKLLEVSVTEESLERALETAQAGARAVEVRVLTQDLATLRAMEEEAERFSEAVGLDSVSTFECIVDRDSHFFMEMNTRIQVEHRVTELCYALQFSNPERQDESFVVESLGEAMVLLAAHGEKLPRPQRIARCNDALEARLNATNQALQPHAGGVVERWSDAIEGEIRDDQGISLHNPDTDVFVKYTLAGAYDSNIALLLTVGDSRLQCYQHMVEVIRRTTMAGRDLATNLEFHYGLVNWFIGQNINARPTTRFIVPYLTVVGALKECAGNVDLVFAYDQAMRRAIAQADDSASDALKEAFERKYSLLRRPLERLLLHPHLLSGWLSVNRDCYTPIDGRISWNENPLELLADTYHFLNMDYQPGEAPANMIWDHDHELLQTAINFYDELNNRLTAENWLELQSQLEEQQAPEGTADGLWLEIRSAHAGFQAGLEILAVLPAIAENTGYFELAVNPDLTIYIPDRLTEIDLQQRMAKVLVPPPAASSDEILAVSGGMFYSRETPEHSSYLEQGSHFEKGDPLYIVEVMKMFNKVYAPFAGTVEQVLVEDDGLIISKGQPLFKITPDELLVIEAPEEIRVRRRQATEQFLSQIL